MTILYLQLLELFRTQCVQSEISVIISVKNIVLLQGDANKPAVSHAELKGAVYFAR